MFTALTNKIANLFTTDGGAGAKAIADGHPLAMFFARGGPIVIKTQKTDRVLQKFEVAPTDRRGRKKAAIAAVRANGYEPLGPALRMGNPPLYAMPVKRTRNASRITT